MQAIECTDHGRSIAKNEAGEWVCAKCFLPRTPKPEPIMIQTALSCNLENPEICESCT